MKTILAFIALAFICLQANSQTISADSATSYVGQKVNVCGTVSGVHSTAKATFINFGKAYPNQVFTAVIFADKLAAFKDVAGYNGKQLCVYGTVQLYQGKPQIILNSPKQVKEN